MQTEPESSQEEWLVQQAKQYPDAFRELYRMIFPRVFAYIAYRVGRNQDAEDLTSETFLKVMEGFDRFEYRGEGSFTAWVFRIAVNVVNGFYRKQIPITLDELPDIQAHDLPPDLALLRKEQFATLHALIQTLAPRRQEVITLRFFGGLRNQEIAAVLNLDERTVASHIKRALDDLYAKYQVEENAL